MVSNLSSSPSERATLLGEFDRHGGGLAATDAKTCNTAFAAGFAQSADQRHDDSCPRCADWMPQGTRAAMDIDLRMRQLVLLHCRHRDDRKCPFERFRLDNG